jgi:hypothetical protein
MTRETIHLVQAFAPEHASGFRMFGIFGFGPRLFLRCPAQVL